MTPGEAHISENMVDFWGKLLPRERADQPCLYFDKGSRTHSCSYKDLNAQAHCVAGFLMEQGLQPGEVVAMITPASLDQLVFDLALQFLGASSMYLPEDLQPDTLANLFDQHKFRFMLVGSHEIYLKYGQFEELKPQLNRIFLSTDDGEGLSAVKLMTFDILVLRGKVIWREQSRELNSRKQAVQGNQVYSHVPVSPEQPLNFEKVSFSRFLKRMESPLPAGPVTSLVPPAHLLQRTLGGFGPLAAGNPLHLSSPEELNAAYLAKTNPSVLVMTTPDLEAAVAELPGRFLEEKSAPQITLANELLDLRDQLAGESKKLPFMKRMKFNSNNKKLYKKIRTALGGKLQAIHFDHQALSPVTSRLLDECELEHHLH